MIPINPPSGGNMDGKRPAIESWTAYMSRTPTEFELRSWFSDKDDQKNIAVITGPISGLAVIDLDDEKSYRDLLSAFPVYEETLTIKTGKGYHVYLRTEETKRTVTFSLNNKIHHIKMLGGYVIAPPSKHISGRNYEFFIETVPTEFDIGKTISNIQDVGGIFSSVETKDRPINWASDLMETCPEGQRNTRAAQLCGLLVRRFNYDHGLIYGLMKAWNNEYCDPPLSKGELDNLVQGEIRRYAER